jgi:PEP-CTERM motif
MKQDRHRNSFVFILAFIFAATVPLHASITYTCGTGISGGTCGTLNTTIADLYNSTFSNANASIFIALGTTGLGQNVQNIDSVPYSTFVSKLLAESTDAAASANVPATEPDTTGDVILTAADANALGIADTAGVESDGATPCSLPGAGCYNGVITITNSGSISLYYRIGTITSGQYDFFSVAEHETDEILGTVSCLGNTGPTTIDRCPGNGIAAADVFRYTSPGTLAWTTSSGAYFSIDKGSTAIATYNNSPNGGDYGDFVAQGTCPPDLVQDFEATPGCSPDITTDAGTPEIQLLNAVGFNLQETTPEPATFSLIGAGLGILAFAAYRRRA